MDSLKQVLQLALVRADFGTLVANPSLTLDAVVAYFL
jgi:hypothetical protein